MSIHKCTTAKQIWTDLCLAYEGSPDTKDAKIDALRLKFNGFKSLDGEKVKGAYIRLKVLLDELAVLGVKIPQPEVNATFVNALPRKWLSMNQAQRDNNCIKHNTLFW